MSSTPNLLTTEDLTQILGISKSKLYRLRSESPESLPPVIRVGSSIRWRPETVAAWLEEQEGKPYEAA